MYLVLSGEGNSDIGHCNNLKGCCEASDFNPRAMALIIDQIIDKWFAGNRGYNLSCLLTHQVTYISEKHLANIPLAQKKKMSFPGKKKPQETKYFYENARSLAVFAQNKQDEFSKNNGDKRKVVAILFRDADGTVSSGRGEYGDKRSSMNLGFKAEGFEYGVAMVPKPKSEAWLLCAVKLNPYQNCNILEVASGNDNSPNSLKNQLSTALNLYSSTNTIEELINNNKIDIDKIQMPSFLEFRSELEHVLNSI